MGSSIKKIGARAIFIALALGFLAGCGGSKEAEKPSTVVDETLKKYEAQFRPSDYDPEPKGGSAHSGQAFSDTADSVEMSPESSTSMELVSGFRVQLVATSSIDEANAKKVEAEGIFPGEWIYVEYDPPSYKVRAGNFQNRVEADRFAKLASGKGFQEAWAVPERVYKSPPPPPRPSPSVPEEQK
jgi:hypothetical protein